MIIAGLMGAAGVILAALAAHKAQALEPAALMLLVHAPAIIAVGAATQAKLLHRAVAHVAAMGLALGAILFSADIALLTLVGGRLFPMAAPAGGFLMIASWLAMAAAALIRPTR
jgi:uncharacterized membrane protein YgdD (TMEM256/DUF423 family)